MKMFVAFFVLFWLICGFAGDWMLEGVGNLHWKTIARGPLTLVEAFNESPVSIPHMS
jgi:hypothetical protein